MGDAVVQDRPGAKPLERDRVGGQFRPQALQIPHLEFATVSQGSQPMAILANVNGLKALRIGGGERCDAAPSGRIKKLD